MKKTQRKDTWRNISKQFISFLSIAIVGMLAVAAYLGINFASDALIANASRYMDRLSFRDVEVTSTMLLTEDDIDAIREVDGVVDAEGVYQVTAKVSKKGQSENDMVDVLSITERISLPDVIEGRLPENYMECAVEKEIMEQLGLKTGDTVMLCGSDGDTVTGLRHKAFRVTGSFVHADHYAKKTYSAGNRYILVTEKSFDQGYFENCYLKAVIKLDRPDGVGRISKDYDGILSGGVSRLDALADERAPMREEDVKDRLREEIAEGQKKLNDAKKELDDGRKELDENAQKIADGEKELKEAWAKLEQAKKQLAAAKKKLDAAKAKLDANKPKLDSAKTELDSAASQLSDAWNQIEAKKTEIRNKISSTVEDVLSAYAPEYAGTISWASPSYPDINTPSLDAADFRITSNLKVNILDAAFDIQDAVNSIVHRVLDGTAYEDRADEFIARINGQLSGTSLFSAADIAAQWNNGHDEYIEKRAEYLAAKKKYDDGLAAYKSGLSEYQDGLRRYNEGLKEYNDGMAELENAKAQLAEGEEKYAEGVKQYEEGLEELQKAKDTVAGLNPCRWIVLDVYGSPAYVHAKSSALNIRKMAMTFAMLFVLIGALVIYATVARIIDEQRKQLGTVKALGFYNREAAVKYLNFGISATLLGVIMGTALGYFVIQWVALMSHETFYVTDGIPKCFNWTLAGISAAAGVLIALLSVWSACAELVKLPAVELMKEKMPVYNVKASPDKAKKASLYSKLIMRNIRNDVRRIFVTVISVAGCCILLVIGFTMKSGIISALERQYNELLKYDQVISFDPEASETVEQDIRELLDDSGVEYTALHCRPTSFNAGNELNAGPLICTDQTELEKNYDLTDITTGEPLTLSDHGVYVTRRIAVYYHINVGDTITIYDSAMTPYEVPVSGIYQYYFGTNLIMSKIAYREVFGEDVQTDGFMLRNCPDVSALAEKLSEITGFENIESNRELYNNSNKAVSALNIVVIVLILAAGVMAYFILLNLANMYINQKKRELTIMRVNGYTTRETIAYVAREAVITTALGIILGVALGSAFGYAILRFVEQRQAGFVLTPNPSAWLLSAWITAVYSFIIYAIALRKVKHLKLTDIA